MKKMLSTAAICLILIMACGKTQKTETPQPSQTQGKLTDQEIQTIIDKVKNLPDEPVQKGEVAVITTDLGTIKFKLLTDIAPKTCANFKKLATAGFYDGTIFHRVIKGFMIQGGDILTRDAIPENDGIGEPGYTIPAEFSKVKHVKGTVSMARKQDPNSAGSQFFICHATAPHLDGQYTAFGEVIEGMDVLDKIAEAPVGERDRPANPVVMIKVRVGE